MLYKTFKIILYPIFKFLFFYKVIGRPEDDKKESIILCANHIHAFDPILLALTSKRKVYFLAKKELFKKKFFAKILENLGAIPVDREASDIRAIKDSLRVLKNKDVLGIFPEGTRVKTVSVSNIKTGIGYIAYRSKADIIPVQIIGDYKLFRRMKVVYKDRINIEKYLDLDKNDAYKAISENVYSSIYSIKKNL